jgi:hypothetical protein
MRLVSWWCSTRTDVSRRRHVPRPTVPHLRRLPEETLVLLKAIGRTIDQPAWRVMVEALRAYVGDGPVLTAAQRRAARALLRLHS